MKLILNALLIFGTMPVLNEYGFSSSEALALSSAQVKPSFQREVSSVDLPVEVELIRMVDPFGNEVKYSLSEQVMGRALSRDDYEIPGIKQVEHSQLCQKTLSQELELRRVELRLELDIIVESLAKTGKPRQLTEAQMDTLSSVPKCENFQLQLTAIAKLLKGYDYESFAMATIQ
ncbi:MAG: hypothetical protein KDD34_01875 [Bdellovibrionales bacterium]|nr:hypothetical protein [Bdellovibrionales bacterium]